MLSLAATLLIYDLGVRRSPITRFLFGLKPAATLTRFQPAPECASRLPLP